MKLLNKIVWIGVLALTSVSAKWEGFYVRASTAIQGNGETGSFRGALPINLAGGYGVMLPGYFHQGLYLGVDFEVVNFNINFGSPVRANEYAPKILTRFGFPYTYCMPYVSPSLGCYSTIDGQFTWGIRGGIDFDFIATGFFWGISVDWCRTINARADNFSILTSGFTFGYRF